MAKPNEKKLARSLRKNGISIKSIAKEVNISTSTASLWCRDIKLTRQQILKLEKSSKDPNYGKRLENSVKQQNNRKIKEEKLFQLGIKDIGSLNKRELFLVGVALYWGEGFKKDSQAGIANQDPKLLKLFLTWAEKCFGYTKNDLIFRLTINESHSHREDEVINYWQTVLDLDKSDFQKTYFQKVQWKKAYDRPQDYKGILRIKIRKSTDFLRKMNGWIEGLSLGV